MCSNICFYIQRAISHFVIISCPGTGYSSLLFFIAGDRSTSYKITIQMSSQHNGLLQINVADEARRLIQILPFSDPENQHADGTKY